jgi:acetyl/propionyl-CoA carboxylase alpha subunit
VVEETPCPVMTPALRSEMTGAALAVARAVDYASAGTVEFLLDPDGRFYFLEMNTRLQVEHPVTEWVTGVDLVAAQLRIAGGESLGLTQQDVAFRGHALEVRVCAEDPSAGFLPSAGPIFLVRHPEAPGVRVDSGIEAGSRVPLEYDPLLAKISAWGSARDQAVRRMQIALRDTAILGPSTNLAFLQDVLAHPAFATGATHTGFIEEHFPAWRPSESVIEAAAVAAALAAGLRVRAAGAPAPSARPSPWDTLGRWRLGV